MTNRGRTTSSSSRFALAAGLASALALALVLALAVAAPPHRAAHAADAKAKTVAKLAQARLDAASTAYAAVKVQLQSGRATPEAAYQWSVRWFQAQRDLPLKGKALATAASDHLARMQDLETAVTQQVQAGSATTADAYAAAYYRAEAELWDARGGK